MTRFSLPARLWREHRGESIALGLLGAAGAAAIAGAAWSTPTVTAATARASAEALPPPPPLLIKPMAPTDAVAVNAAVPLEMGPNPPARPFLLGKAGESSRSRALDCLTSAIHYEAGQESADGQRAVAQVILNRVRHPAFPASVCGVVYQGSTRQTGCQFTFTCDGSLTRPPSAESWNRARRIATAALAGSVHAPVGTATHYHANYVVPYWASSLAKSAVIGTHIFYRWAGNWGRPGAFAQAYAMQEPDSGALRMAALSVDRTAAAEADVAAIPGAEPLAAKDIGPGGRRVGVRFQLAARQAVEEAVREPYVEKVEASSTLRWALEGRGESDQQAFGKTSAPVASAAGAAPQ